MKKKLILYLFLNVWTINAQIQLCYGTSTTLQASVSTSLTNVSYSINPGGTTSAASIFTIAPLATTIYTLYTTGSNGQSQITSAVIKTVSVFPQPAFAPSFTQITCTSTLNGLNLGLSFLPLGSTPNYTISWMATPPLTTPAIPTGITSLTQVIAIGNIVPGPYGAVVTSAGNCTASVLFTMAATPAPANFNFVPWGNTPSITCTDPEINVFANNTLLNYTWTSNSFGQIYNYSVSLSVLDIGKIFVIGTHPVSGCTNSKTLTLYNNQIYPHTQASQLYTISCPSGTAKLNPEPDENGPYTYSWTVSASVPINNPTAPSIIVNSPGDYTLTVTNSQNGCTTKAVYGVWACVGINEYKQNLKVKVYPNPGNGLFHVECENRAEYLKASVYNVLGELVFEKNLLYDDKTIQLNQGPGIYNLWLESPGSRSIIKIIKE